MFLLFFLSLPHLCVTVPLLMNVTTRPALSQVSSVYVSCGAILEHVRGGFGWLLMGWDKMG